MTAVTALSSLCISFQVLRFQQADCYSRWKCCDQPAGTGLQQKFGMLNYVFIRRERSKKQHGRSIPGRL